MKTLALFSLFIVFHTQASPLEKMRGKLADYNQMMAPDHCAPAKGGNDFSPNDYGLMTSVECEITCKNQPAKRQRTTSAFIPKSFGLYPGDGSSSTNTIWRSLAVTMKVWSEEVCLQEAASICKNLDQVSQSEVIEIESGEWKLNRTLGCQEKEVTLSPFDNTVNSKRLPAPMVQNLEIANISHPLSVLDQAFALAEKPVKTECTHKMNADLCFGDCVHDMKDGSWKETLATPESLGTAKIEWCMDEVVGLLKKQNMLSFPVKVKICEAYFWSSMMHSHGAGSSCAAMRGTHDCEKLVQGL